MNKVRADALKKLQKIIFASIIILAIFLRIYSLDKNPPSLFADEVDVGYQAYSLLKTGKDYQSNFLPISFKSFADFRTPLYIYSAVPAVWIFGLNEWAVRLPAAIFGVVGIIGIYFLVKELGFNIWVSLISSLLLAVSPWHLQYSRAGFEVTLMIALLVWAVVCFFRGFRSKKLFLISALLFSLTVYSYSTAKLFVPLFILGLGFLYRKNILKISRKLLLSFFIILIIVSLPFLIDLKNGQALYRFSYTSIFADPTIPQEIDVLRLADNPKVTFESKIAHNKLLSLADLFTKNYLNSFSMNFLFLQGDPIGRHSVGKMGELYIIEILTIITGLFCLFKKYESQKKLILFWLVIAPISASLIVGGGNHATRLFLMVIPLTILSALGFYQLFRRKAILFLVIIVFIFNLYTYFHQYYIHYPKEQERLWHYGFKQAILEAQVLQDSYDKIMFTPTTEPPLIFLLFWTKYDPATFQNNSLKKMTVPNFGEDITKLDKFYISSLDPKISQLELQNVIDKKTLVIANRKDIPGDLRREKIEGIKVVDIIGYPSGEVAFYLLTHE